MVDNNRTAPFYLRELRLGNNRLGDLGCERIAEALPRWRYLTVLDLSGNGIGDNGAGALARGVGACPRLKCLDLERNNIWFRGCLQLAKHLKAHNLEGLRLGIHARSILGKEEWKSCKGAFNVAFQLNGPALVCLLCSLITTDADSNEVGQNEKGKERCKQSPEERALAKRRELKVNAVFHWLVDGPISCIISTDNEFYRDEFPREQLAMRVKRLSRLIPGGRVAENFDILSRVGILDPDPPKPRQLRLYLPDSVGALGFCSLCWSLYAEVRCRGLVLSENGNVEILFRFLEEHVTPVDDERMDKLLKRVRESARVEDTASSPHPPSSSPYVLFKVEMLLAVCKGLVREFNRNLMPNEETMKVLEHLEVIAIVLDFAAALNCIPANNI